MNMNGPVEISRQERLEICYELANRLQEVYDKQIIAIGVYGSVSRGTDGPYSDIEMLCVLKNADEEVDFSYEWSIRALEGRSECTKCKCGSERCSHSGRGLAINTWAVLLTAKPL